MCFDTDLSSKDFLYYLRKGRQRGERKWLGRELNPRHEDFQSSALPTELPSQRNKIKIINQ